MQQLISLALVYARRGRARTGQPILRRALTIDPFDDEATTILAGLEENHEETRHEPDRRVIGLEPSELRDASRRWKAPLLAATLAGTASCGVKDYLHEQAPVDPNSDLAGTTVGTGPATGTSATTGTTSTSGTTGSSVVATSAGPRAHRCRHLRRRRQHRRGWQLEHHPGHVFVDDRQGGDGRRSIDRRRRRQTRRGGRSGTAFGGGDQPRRNDGAQGERIAFIHVGHSNMAGRATAPAASRPYHMTQTDPLAWAYRVGHARPARARAPNCGRQLLRQLRRSEHGARQRGRGAGSRQLFHLARLRRAVGVLLAVSAGSLYYDAADRGTEGDQGSRDLRWHLHLTWASPSATARAADINGFPNCINELVTAIRTDVGEPNLPLLHHATTRWKSTGEFAVTSSVRRSIIPQIARGAQRGVEQRARPHQRPRACRTTITSTSTGHSTGCSAPRDHARQGLVSLGASP